MELAKIEATRADARKICCGTLTSGMVGAEVSFSFDASWDGLKRIATFKAGGTSKDVLLTEGRCEIPHEVLAEACQHLMVGIYGTNADGTLAIPTVWADLGTVNRGAKPTGDASKKPTPEVWAQILGMIGDLKKLNTEDKSNLVAAINEVLLNGADPKEIQRIVEEYLEEHSIEAETGITAESDPTVFDWAKKELFNKANLIDPAGRNTFITIDGVDYYRYHCSEQNFEYDNPHPLPGSVTITIRTVSQYTDGVSGVVLHYADGTSEVIYPKRGVVTIYTTDASKTFVKMSGRYDMENWNLIDMSVMSIQANYNIGIPVANANAPGGIKAEPVAEEDTQPVRIGADGKLYTAPGGGVPGNGQTVAAPLPLLADVTSEEALSHFEVTLSKRAVRRVLVQISVPASDAMGGACYGALNGGLWDATIFGNTALAANAKKWMELELMEGGLAKYTVSESSGNLWNLNTIRTAGALEKIGYVDSIGIRLLGQNTAPAGTRLQVWGE